ncbi:MAG: Flp pilus assembly complex ATPase component TadA [Desulfamplus sp.]|nr:Flp pilus assembly complex ATPase component TadA [Desulfamplus sp.]
MINKFLQILSDKIDISSDNIEKIKKQYYHDPILFTDALLTSAILEEDLIFEIIGLIYSLPYIKNISQENLYLTEPFTEHGFTEHISIHFLKKYCMVPVVREDLSIFITLNNPCDLAPADDIASFLNLSEYEIMLAPKSEILSAINNLYHQTTESARQLVENMEENGTTIIKAIEETSDLLDDTSDAPVIRLVNHMISQSVKANASDIHIEPFQDSIKIRYRIDGILYDLLEPPKWIQSALVSRIKVMADMDIAEKRVPQDGRLEVRMGQQKIDIRVSTVPTSFGERLVMRLLNKSGTLLELSQSGISSGHLAIFNRLISLNNGIVLVTGPTGSGKTTTLYAALSKINSPDKNIITIEDPVEYNLKGIGQIQVNRKIGMTFAKGLRSIVRQDPDVILVGEIRDLETAEIAIQSALTGHLVFSTLHTNDSPGAVTRLVDLGVEPYLITSSVKAIAAQRLVRVLCPHCKSGYIPDAGERALLEAGEQTLCDSNSFDGTDESLPGSKKSKLMTISEKDKSRLLNTSESNLFEKEIFRPTGCPRCFGTGYTGRQAIFEIMEIDDVIKNVILTTSDANQIKRAAMGQGMTTLRQDGISKVLQGVTSMEEVVRVTQEL